MRSKLELLNRRDGDSNRIKLVVELRSLVVAGTPKIFLWAFDLMAPSSRPAASGWRRDELAELQCSRCGLHGAVSIIISFRAYNLTPRELQVVNQSTVIRYSFKNAIG